MRLSIVGSLRGPITTNAYTPELRMNRERRQIALQKVAFQAVKGHLLYAKTWPFAKSLIINGLQACYGCLMNTLLKRVLFRWICASLYVFK